MADINEYDIQYLQYLEKIGMTPPQLRHQQLTGQLQNSSCSKRKLFQNTTDDMEIQMEPTYQRINSILVLTEKNIREINQTAQKNSAILENLEGKSPIQEQNTSLIPPLEARLDKNNDGFFDENNQDNSNRTNLCYYSKKDDGKKFPTYRNSMKNQDKQKQMELEEPQNQQPIPEETQQQNIQQEEEIIVEQQVEQENELEKNNIQEVQENLECLDVVENVEEQIRQIPQEPLIPQESEIPQEINQDRALIEQICQDLIASQQKVMLEIENIIQKSRANSESSIVQENLELNKENEIGELKEIEELNEIQVILPQEENLIVVEPVINDALILSLDQVKNEIAKAEEPKIIEMQKKVKTEKQIEKRKQSRKINKKKRKERKQQERKQQERKNSEQQLIESKIQQEKQQNQISQKEQQKIVEQQEIPNPVSNILMNFLDQVQQVPCKKVIKNWAQCSYLQNRFYRKRIILKLSSQISKSFNK